MDGPSPAERNAMARRLISRNKLEEALDILNETIRQDPRFAETFENRAAVFEAMGMHPHAQADRRRAAGLRAAQPGPPSGEPFPEAPSQAPSPEAPSGTPAERLAREEAPADDLAAENGGMAEAEPQEPDVSRPSDEAIEEPEDVSAAPASGGGPPDEPPPPVMPTYPQPPRRSVGGALLRAAGVVFFALGLFTVAGVGIYLALGAIGDSASDEPTPSATESPGPTDEPTDVPADGEANGDGDLTTTVEEALRGSPYSFSHLEDAWHAEALAVTIGTISESVVGFARPAVDVTLTGGGGTMELSVLLYSSADAKDDEWTSGSKPEPKVAATLPETASVWYNGNAVVIVRVSDGAIRQAALDGFLAVGTVP